MGTHSYVQGNGYVRYGVLRSGGRSRWRGWMVGLERYRHWVIGYWAIFADIG